WPGVMPPKAEERSRRRLDMERRARALQVFTVADAGRTPVPLLPEPLLYYRDSVRYQFEDSVWAWGSTGRPVALLTLMESRPQPTPQMAPPVAGIAPKGPPQQGSIWTYELVSLANG